MKGPILPAILTDFLTGPEMSGVPVTLVNGTFPHQFKQKIMDDRYVEEELQGNSGGFVPDDPDPADRIIATVTAPRRAFDGLLRARNLNAVIGVGAVVLIILSIASTFILGSSEIFQEQQTERMERMEDAGDVDAARLEQMREGMEMEPSLVLVGLLTGMVIAIPIFLLVIGLIVLAVAKVFERGHETYIRYRHALAVATLSLIPPFVIYFLLALLQLVAGVDVSVLGLHALVAPEQVIPYVALSTLSPQNIVWFVVAGVGTAAIAGSGVRGPIITYAAIALVIMIAFGVISSLVPGFAPV